MFKLISEMEPDTPPGLLIPIDGFSHELSLLVSRMNLDETRTMEALFHSTPHQRILRMAALTGSVATRDIEFRSILKESSIVQTLRRLEAERRPVVVQPESSEQDLKP